MIELKNGIKIGGYFIVECVGPDGQVKWVERADNLITNVGLDHILDVVLGAATQVDPWYVGLKNAGTIAAGDTLASHAGWTENSNYTGNRQAYVEDASSGQSVTNTAGKAAFPIDTDTQTIAGAFLCSVATTTTGTLLCAADFASAKAADDGDTLNVTYTVGAADDGA